MPVWRTGCIDLLTRVQLAFIAFRLEGVAGRTQTYTPFIFALCTRSEKNVLTVFFFFFFLGQCTVSTVDKCLPKRRNFGMRLPAINFARYLGVRGRGRVCARGWPRGDRARSHGRRNVYRRPPACSCLLGFLRIIRSVSQKAHLFDNIYYK